VVVARKRPAAGSPKVKGGGGTAPKPERPVSPGNAGKGRDTGAGGPSTKDEAARPPATGAGQADRSPPALPIPIASFTF
jgi:hypothetical protein